MSINTAPAFVIGDGQIIPEAGFVIGYDSYPFYCTDAMVLADGRVLAAGYTNSPGTTLQDFGLVRYNANGTLDTSFSDDGWLTTDIGNYYNVAWTLTTQSDGKILVAGYAGIDGHGSGDDRVFAVVRYNTDGTLDSTFSGDGIATVDMGGDDIVRSVKVQPDGKILVAGSSINSPYFDLARFNADGSLDTGFGSGGKMSTNLGEGSYFYGESITLQTDGKILFVGSADFDGEDSNFALLRYNSNGSLDASFGAGGMAIVDFLGADEEARSVAVQSDGKILVAGYAYNMQGGCGFAIARFNANGTLDASFAGGEVVTYFGDYASQAYSVAVQSDGKILVSGEAYGASGTDFALVRYNTDGTLDTSFSGDGMLTTDFGGSDVALRVTALSDGRIVVLGRSSAGEGPNNFVYARYNADGSLDSTLDKADTLNGVKTFTEGGAATDLDSHLRIFDAELEALNGGYGNYDGASLTLARHGGANADDVFTGAIGLNIGAQGGAVELVGTTFGTATVNGNGTLTITFNANATSELVNQLVPRIYYSNTSEAPPESVVIDWTFNDGNAGSQGTGGALQAFSSTRVDITAVNDAHTGGVAISGTAKVGETLTANSTLADADGMGTLHYQWLADGDTIDGAPDSSSFTLTGAQIGKAITVAVSYTDGGGTLESAISAATSAVVDAYNEITGTAGADNLNGTADIDVISGLAGNDSINGGAGNDSIDGGAGSDTAVFAGMYSAYTLTVTTDEGMQVAGSDGLDTLRGIERLVFNDAVVLVHDSAEFRVNTSTSNSQSNASVTALSDGGWVVTWQSDGQDGSGYGIYSQRYSSAGTKVGAESKVNTYTTDDQSSPSVTALSDGGWVVTWQSYGQGENGFLEDIYGQRYSSAGAKVGAEFRVNTSTSWEQTCPSVTMLSDGGWVVAWMSDLYGDYYNNNDICIQRYSSSGAKVGSESRVNTYTNSSQNYPSVTALSDGGWVMTWQSYDQDGSSYGIYGQRYSSAGAEVGSEFRVNTYTNSSQNYPSVTALSDGGWVMTWQSYDQDGSSYGIYGQRYSSEGTKVDSEFRINTYKINEQCNPSVTALSDGGWVVTWQSDGQDGSGYGVYAQRYFATELDSRAIASVEVTGNGSSQELSGTEVDDTIDGLGGNDTLIGGLGNDMLNGGAGNDSLNGSEGNDIIDGGIGNDSMAGGTGDDIYYVYSNDDTVIENDDEGNDKVYAITDGYTLAGNVEDLELSGYAISGFGNDLNNTITGSGRLYGYAGNDTLCGGDGDFDHDTLDGGTGDDSMIGGEGNDTYYVDSAGDTVVEGGGFHYFWDGWLDKVYTTLDSYTLGANVESLAYIGAGNFSGTGNGLDNNIVGSSGNDTRNGGDGNDTLDGGKGFDSMTGGIGDDTYYVNDYYVDGLFDTITEEANGGMDTIRTVFSTFTLGANLENLAYIGTAQFKGVGNVLDNHIVGLNGSDTLYGGIGNDTLDGGMGADSMLGGQGNDTYIINSNADVITEALSADIDTVKVAFTKAGTYTVAANVEIATVDVDFAINLTGNALANILTGNDLVNVLSGGGGGDFLYGLGGNDSLNGGGGADNLYGGAGDDTYTVDNALDVIVENAGEGADSVKVAIAAAGQTYVLSANIEAATLVSTVDGNLTGNSSDNTLIGNAWANIIFGAAGNDIIKGGGGNDVLIGGEGNDSMYGGAGNDTYYVDSTDDKVYETTTSTGTTDATGVDTVVASVNWTLGLYVEKLTLAEDAGAINGTGNGLGNTIKGNEAANILDGDAGADTINGGGGNDSLIGGAGADKLIGGAGNDTLQGGTGADIFVFNAEVDGDSNVDVIADFVHGTDKIQLENAIFGRLTTLGALGAGKFHSGGTDSWGAADANDFILYDTSTGDLYYDETGNINGSVDAVRIATLTSKPVITAADFVVI